MDRPRVSNFSRGLQNELPCLIWRHLTRWRRMAGLRAAFPPRPSKESFAQIRNWQAAGETPTALCVISVESDGVNVEPIFCAKFFDLVERRRSCGSCLRFLPLPCFFALKRGWLGPAERGRARADALRRCGRGAAPPPVSATRRRYLSFFEIKIQIQFQLAYFVSFRIRSYPNSCGRIIWHQFRYDRINWYFFRSTAFWHFHYFLLVHLRIAQHHGQEIFLPSKKLRPPREEVWR